MPAVTDPFGTPLCRCTFDGFYAKLNHKQLPIFLYSILRNNGNHTFTRMFSSAIVLGRISDT